MATRRRVVMIQSTMRDYRASFFEALRRRLASADVQLDLVYSTPTGRAVDSGETIHLPWAHHVDERRIGLGSFEVTWQSCRDVVRGADLVVVEQATRRLLNYPLLARQAWGGPPVAFWGHGRNFQAASALHRGAEWVKRFATRRSNWFFAYNDLSAEILGASGYPDDRITVVGNSIDTKSLAAARDSITADDTRMLRDRLGVAGRNVAIYCGSMYREKRIPLLIEAAHEVKTRLPDFELICVGSGTERSIVEEAASAHDWIHYVGPQLGVAKARYYALARVTMLPGLVGLAILDSFVFGVPMVTAEDALHSPEIGYLENGRNGIMVGGEWSETRYADAVVALLTEDDLREKLIGGCRESIRWHSSEAMAERFAEGIVRALSA